MSDEVIDIDEMNYHLAMMQNSELAKEVVSLRSEIELLRGWTFVEEKLPEDGRRVLVLSWAGYVYIAYHNTSIHQWATDHGTYYHGDSYNMITHWRPLPPPPEQDEGGGR